MKRAIRFFIAVILVLSMLLAVAACIKPIENPDNGSPGGNNQNNNNNNNNNNGGTTHPYAALFAQLLAKINGVNSLEGYLDALVYMLDLLPVDKLASAVGTLAGEEYAGMVADYYEKGRQLLPIVNLAAPYFPYLNNVNLIRTLLKAENPIAQGLARAALTAAGVTIDGDTYTYTHNGVVYAVTVDDDTYTIAFSGKEIIIQTFESNENMYDITFTEDEAVRNFLLVYSANDYQITENGIRFDIRYDEDKNSLLARSTDVGEGAGIVLFDFQACIVNSADLAVQFYQTGDDAMQIIQFLTKVSEYKIDVSFQAEAALAPEDIIISLPSDFATKGTVFSITEDILASLLD